MSREYIMTLLQLEEVKIANLGPMDQKSYEDFLSAAEIAAKAASATSAKLILGTKFNNGTECPYPVTRNDWATVLQQVSTMCSSMPEVYVVDGSKYTTLI